MIKQRITLTWQNRNLYVIDSGVIAVPVNRIWRFELQYVMLTIYISYNEQRFLGMRGGHFVLVSLCFWLVNVVQTHNVTTLSQLL